FRRILRRKTSLVVVEIHEDVLQSAAPMLNPVGPRAKSIGAVIPLILVSGAMEADVGEVRSELDGGQKTGEFIDAEGGIVPAQYVIDFGDIPSLIAKLEHVAVSRWKAGEKFVEPLQI